MVLRNQAPSCAPGMAVATSARTRSRLTITRASQRRRTERRQVLSTGNKEKDKLRKSDEIEIEQLKEELRQQKDREDHAHRQITQRLKQQSDDLDRSHHDHKHLDTEYKKLITESDQQQEKMIELRNEVQRAETTLVEERVEKAK